MLQNAPVHAIEVVNPDEAAFVILQVGVRSTPDQGMRPAYESAGGFRLTR